MYTNLQIQVFCRELDPTAIYYNRELAIRSYDGNRVDLITISSYEGISEEREHDLPHLFPEREYKAASYRFRHKRVKRALNKKGGRENLLQCVICSSGVFPVESSAPW